LVSNEQFFGQYVGIADSVTPEMRNVLFDPQTSGGLLIFCHQDDTQALVNKLHAAEITATEIGFTANPTERLLTVH